MKPLYPHPCPNCIYLGADKQEPDQLDLHYCLGPDHSIFRRSDRLQSPRLVVRASQEIAWSRSVNDRDRFVTRERYKLVILLACVKGFIDKCAADWMLS